MNTIERLRVCRKVSISRPFGINAVFHIVSWKLLSITSRKSMWKTSVFTLEGSGETDGLMNAQYNKDK